MSDYTKSTNFATKDNLTPGDPLKIVRGTEIDTEFNNIAIAIATKTDNASAAITGGSITGITDLAIADGGTGASTANAALNNLLPSQTSASGKYLKSNGTDASWDQLDISTADITGTLPVANGGTGVTSSTGTGSVVLSNSPTLVTPALGTPASGVATNLTGLPLTTGVTGTLPIANGGTGQTTANAAFNALAPSQATASGKYLKSDGTNTSWDALDISTADITGTLPVANGGTGVTTSTGTGSTVLSNSPTLVTPALGTPSSATLTNATGLPISTGVSGLGTGVATALAVNTGSAGAFVVNGGALGTPSSGTVTNLTGTASININGTVGATTANTGAFTTLSASSTVSGTGFSTYLASPPAIGGTTAAAGSFTTLSASSTLSVTGAGTIQGLTVGRGAGSVSTNTAVGASALAANSTGAQNTTVGNQAGATTNAAYLTAVGYQAARYNTGDGNTAIGTNALLVAGGVNGTGTNNTAVGKDALYTNTTASNNTAVGYQAGYSNQTGTDIVAIGYKALYANINGGNTAVGINSSVTNTTGFYNSSFGASSLYFNTTGAYNVALGHSALLSNTTASNNTAVGYQAGYTNSTGQYNTYIGGRGPGYNATGSQNTFVGDYAGREVLSGSANTFIGQGSGYLVTTGEKNTILGVYSGNQGGLDIHTANNFIVLSDGDGNPKIYFDPGTGTHFGGTSSADTTLLYSYGTYNYASGASANMGINSSGFMYRSTSSLKYKKNVQDAVHGLAEVMQLRPVTYESKQEVESGVVYGGLIAEEVHAAGLTEFVQYAEDGTPDALAYGNMVSLCIKAIQELKSELDSVKAELATLKGA